MNPLPTNTLAGALHLMVSVNQVSFDELAEVRGALEGHNAFVAAGGSAPDELRLAVAALEEAAATAEDDWQGFTRAERVCHGAVMRAANNRLVEALHAALDSTTTASMVVDIGPESRDRVIDDWRQLLAAIERGDADLARELMVAHIRHFSRVVSEARRRSRLRQRAEA